MGFQRPLEDPAISDVLDRTNSIGEIRAALAQSLPDLGVTHAAYCGLAPPWEDAARTWAVVVTYPDIWIRRYRQKEYLRSDPVVVAGLSAFSAVDWRDLARDERALQLFEEAAEHGVGPQGLTFPLRGPTGQLALFSVTSDCDASNWDRLKRTRTGDWLTLGMALHARMLELAGAKAAGAATRLSPRQIQALQLTANGMTSDAVAQRMAISERVVRAHLQTCRLKLNAANTTHAVARAVQIGLIHAD